MKNSVQKFAKTNNSKTYSKGASGTFFKSKDQSSPINKSKNNKTPGFFQPSQKNVEKQNNTGMSDKLKSGIESMSGIDTSDVKVHRNSSKPLQLDALAYTEGTDIYIGAGQEKHLPHEAWHVVQQKQGRVNLTYKVGDKNINDNVVLENEATTMGQKAAISGAGNVGVATKQKHTLQKKAIQGMGIIQKVPIPASAIILDVGAGAEVVLNFLIGTAMSVNSQWSSVNWRNMFLGVITQQLTGRRLGTISHAWRDNTGLDASWTATISFDIDSPQRTERPTERRNVTNTAGGTSSNSLGNTQSNTTGTSVSITGGSSSSVGAEAGPVSAESGSSSSRSVGFTDSHAEGSSGASGGGMSSSASSASAEQISRYLATLRVNIDLTCEAAYSNWDIINPVKWGGHLAGRQHRSRTYTIGTITYDLPDYSR
jgi:hypothetical protein